MKKATTRTTITSSEKTKDPVKLPITESVDKTPIVSIEDLPELAERKTSTVVQRLDAIEKRLEALIAQLSK